MTKENEYLETKRLNRTKMSDIYIEEYSERAMVVRGDTKKYKEQLKELKCKFNPSLKNGPGWIFSKKRQSEIEEFIEGITPPSSQKEERKDDRLYFTVKQYNNICDTSSRMKKTFEVVKNGTEKFLTDRGYIHEVKSIVDSDFTTLIKPLSKRNGEDDELLIITDKEYNDICESIKEMKHMCESVKKMTQILNLIKSGMEKLLSSRKEKS